MSRCPKATTVTLKQENAFARQNRGGDSLNRWAWLVLAKTWLLLAKTQEIAKKNIEVSGQELTH